MQSLSPFSESVGSYKVNALVVNHFVDNECVDFTGRIGGSIHILR